MATDSEDDEPIEAMETLVQGRARRSTAGNRMRALLDKEYEREELFEEAEGDASFEENELEDDSVDSDFDKSSEDENAANEDDEEAGERELEEIEKEDKKAARFKAKTAATTRFTKTVARPAQRPAFEREFAETEEQPPPAKKRKVSLAVPGEHPEQKATEAGGLVGVRKSSRASTVLNKLETEEKLKEAEERRVSFALKRPKVVPRPRLTQDALIAEALETEEANRKSLAAFLEQEEERKKRQRMTTKKGINGPFIRYWSVTDRTRGSRWVKEPMVQVVQLDKKAEAGADTPTPMKKEDGPLTVGQQTPVQPTSVNETDRAKETEGSKETESIKETEAGKETKSVKETEEGKATEGVKGTEGINEIEGVLPTARREEASLAVHPSEPSQQEVADPSEADKPISPTTSPKIEHSTDAEVSKSTDIGVDAVITQAQSSQPSNVVSASAETAKPVKSANDPPEGRTLISVHGYDPEEWDWVQEWSAIFGDHVDWSCYPVVQSRNRPQKPRQSICPITGQPALYKDRRTGIAYANASAYKTLSSLLDQGFVWQPEFNCHLGDPSDAGVGGVFEAAWKESRGKQEADDKKRRKSRVALT